MKIVVRRAEQAYIDNWLWVPKTHVNVEGMKNALTFTFVDPRSDEKTRSVRLWRETDSHLLLPREFWKPEQLPYSVVDCRPKSYPKAGFRSRIKLDHKSVEGRMVPTGEDVQQRALGALLTSPGGILQLACGLGKTVVFLELTARTHVPTLMIVPDTHLMEQWEGEVNRFLDVPGGIGFIRSGSFDWKKNFVLATYHSIAARAEQLQAEGATKWFGLIGWDEGHHISAPTFAPSAEMFPGKRIALTATPTRDDGTHIIYDHHIGPVVFKDLRQELKPRIIFKHTGLVMPTEDEKEIRDRTREVHLGKVSEYFAGWKPRLEMILSDVKAALDAGRQKVLVLSYSVAEICNLAALWTYGETASLYTDIPEPDPAHIGETLPGILLSDEVLQELHNKLAGIKSQLSSPTVNPLLYTPMLEMEKQIEQAFRQHDIAKRLISEMNKRQRQYIRALDTNLVDCGALIYEIPAARRLRTVKDKRVIFAIMKYGKEGLDSKVLDTVIVSVPFSQRNGLQQVMGRALRKSPDKMTPIVMFYEDNIGPITTMCKKLQRHLRDWQPEEGGPFEYHLVNYPYARTPWSSPIQMFGP